MALSIPVPGDLKDIHRQMKDAGMQLFIVGGAVRDTLMDKVPKDYDLATDAQPEAVIDLLRQDPDLRIDLTGRAFGVVRVKTPAGEEYEIATFRRDLSGGRRPDAVEFTTIENDVKRRDLTINALFYDMDTGEVVDYVGGIDDIKDGVIRAVGNPAERFDEDKLRILRAVRFAGRTGSDLDPETRDAILADNDLEEVSAERTTEEFVKGIQSAQDVTHFLGMMEDLGLFSQIFPGLQVKLSGGKTKDHVVQIAAMLSGNDPNEVKVQLQKMKYSKADAETIKLLIDLQALDRGSASTLKKEFKRLRANPERVVEFAKLVDGFSPKKAKGFIKFAQSPPAVNPRDLMAKGLRGPDIGKAVKDAEEDAYEKLVSEIRRQVRALLKEVAIGQCYPHAVNMAKQASDAEWDDLGRFKVVHGKVTDKWSGESYEHSWVEKGNMVFDWQTQQTKPAGVPKDLYYDMFQPEAYEEYTAKEAVINCVKSGQAGPWRREYARENLSEQVRHQFKGDSNFFRVSLPGIGYIEMAQKLGLKECQSDVDKIMKSSEYLAATKKYEEVNPPRTDIIRNEETGKYEAVEIGPAVMRPSFYVVYKAFIDNPAHKGKGYGKELYREAIRRAAEYAHDSCVFVAPLNCTLGSGTSLDAMRVWKSLSREYTSSGNVIFVRTN